MTKICEFTEWLHGKYPYDRATCGFCISMHADGWCDDPQHEELRIVSSEQEVSKVTHSHPPDRQKAINIRELFRDFYPQQPQKEEQHEQQPETATAT